MAKQGTAGSSRGLHKPKIVEIERIVQETRSIKSFRVDFPGAAYARPGQFVMVWVPGVDEVPMSVTWVNGDELTFATAKVGDATAAMHELKEGDKIGIRGFYGNSFDLSGESILMVAGGCGAAPITFAAKAARDKQVMVILGAKSADELLFKSRMEAVGARVIVCTDDGSAGVKGFATDLLPKILTENNFDKVITCGPEVMMAKVVAESEVPVQVSLERYMKCGIGICGQCSIDPIGVCVCKDGPVFPADRLKGGEFGKYARNSAGVKKKLRSC